MARRRKQVIEQQGISVRGAREHNLRNVSLNLPKNRLICFTGVSGSGKSSLAFDTLYAEGQRRYIESLSAYARQFLMQLSKPDVDQITGLSPAIAIQQKSAGWNPRSTVGTVTGIYDFLRVLFARVGKQHCPKCDQPITAQTSESIVARIALLEEGSRVLILAPVVRGQKGEHVDLLADLRRRGFVRARVDGDIIHLSEPPALTRNNRHDIEVVVDRVTIGEAGRSRLSEAVENALALGDGTVMVLPADTNEAAASGRDARSDGRKGKRARSRDESEGKLVLSSKYACVNCGIGFDAPSPQLFSFNSPTGMCLQCDGMGSLTDFDVDLMIPDPTLPFYAPVIEPMRTKPGKWRRHIYEGVARHVGFDIRKPWNALPQEARDALLYGTGDAHITYQWRYGRGVWKHGGPFEGVIAELQSKYRQAKAGFVRAYYEKYMRRRPCSACGGARLNGQARAMRINGRSLPEVVALSVKDAAAFFEAIALNDVESVIAAEVLKEVRGRLGFLSNVGLDYLTLDRTAPTLSGGESQRIRLAGQIGCGLVGVLYVLDEPSIGLHARDNKKLLESLKRLRDMGNTVIVVEHDEETMRESDLVVDFGPGPGVRGGDVVGMGSLEDLREEKQSLTGAYLSGEREIAIPESRRPVDVSTLPGRAQKGVRKRPVGRAQSDQPDIPKRGKRKQRTVKRKK